jgi:hypothetical protein
LVFHLILNLNGIATNLTILHITLALHRNVQHHGNLLPAIRAAKRMLHKKDPTLKAIQIGRSGYPQVGPWFGWRGQRWVPGNFDEQRFGREWRAETLGLTGSEDAGVELSTDEETVEGLAIAEKEPMGCIRAAREETTANQKGDASIEVR